MALDWSKEISFSGLMKKTPKKKAVYPSKRYINLMPRKERNNDASRVVPAALLIIVLVAAFGKFGVYDFFDRVNQKQAEVTAQKQILNSYESQLTDYETVAAEYEAYETPTLATMEDRVSAMDAMALVDKYIAPKASIASIDYKENTITLSLVDIKLDSVGQLVSTLYEQEIVTNVSVSTASTESTSSGSGSTNVTAAMVISLQKV